MKGVAHPPRTQKKTNKREAPFTPGLLIGCMGILLLKIGYHYFWPVLLDGPSHEHGTYSEHDTHPQIPTDCGLTTGADCLESCKV
jgi:hypothetical protein